MADNTKYLQAQAFSLAGAGCIMGATTIVLNSMLQIDGETEVTMTDFGAKGFATIEPGNGTREEQIVFTGITQNANGTATLTGVSNVLFAYPYTETSGTTLSHPGGVTLVISNTSGFYNRLAALADDETVTGLWVFPNDASTPKIGASYVAPTLDTQIATKKYIDDIAIAGSPDASTTTKGISKLSAAPVSPTDPIAAGTNDTRIPTQNENDALVGTGTPSSSNVYVTNDTFLAAFPAGIIQMYGGSSAPTGWLFCDGASVLRATYAALFTAISTTYGSADGTHFNVPDLRGRVPIGVGTGTGGGASGTGLPTGGDALTAVARASWKGEQTHVLTVGELATHSHVINNAGTGGAGGNIVGTQLNSTGTTTTGDTGSNTAHNNIQPVMGVNFIIKT